MCFSKAGQPGEGIPSMTAFHLFVFVPLFCITILAIRAFCYSDKELLSSAELFTKEGVTYGRYEVRMRMVAADGVISSFFLWKDKSEKSESSWHEIDIEVLGGNPKGFQSAIHYGRGGWENMAHEESFHALDKPLTTRYHTFALEWTPDYISWKLDDSLIRKDTGDLVKKFRDVSMQLRFNIWPSMHPSWAGVFKPAALPKHMYINWIKYYRYTPDGKEKFSLSWEENFNSATLDKRWLTGFWESPDKASTHLDKNVTITDGAAVLTLSPLSRPGYHGVIPQDYQGGTTFPEKYRRGRGR